VIELGRDLFWTHIFLPSSFEIRDRLIRTLFAGIQAERDGKDITRSRVLTCIDILFEFSSKLGPQTTAPTPGVKAVPDLLLHLETYRAAASGSQLGT
jgi:hypothetical protein